MWMQYVAYVIRVMDGGGEWTVTRRYRNFETLHATLCATCPAYRELRTQLPSKRLFNFQDVSFVHQRRKELDAYLGGILR